MQDSARLAIYIDPNEPATAQLVDTVSRSLTIIVEWLGYALPNVTTGTLSHS